MQANCIARCLLPLALGSAYAYGAGSHQSFYGQTGLLTIPNAQIALPGEARVQYTDYFFNRNDPRHGQNLIGNFGVAPSLEIGGRVAWFETQSNCFINCGGPRDLSGHFKWQVPWIPDDWFQLAVGATDLGGQANHFSSEYLVASRSFGRIELSAGYGRRSTATRSGPDFHFLDGPFGGASWQVAPWLNLMAEFDSADVQAGLNLSTPPDWFGGWFQAGITGLLYTTQNDERQRQFHSLAIAMQLKDLAPAKPPAQEIQPIESTAESSTRTGASSAGRSAGTQRRLTPMPAPPFADERLVAKLESIGFERITFDRSENWITVSIENNTFNRNEIDAIGVALGLMADAYKYRQIGLRLILKNKDLPILTATTTATDYNDFLNGENPNPLSIRFADANLNTDTTKQLRAGGHFWKPRITLSPLLSNTLASEVGVWDYSWGLQTNVVFQLWRGALISAAYNGSIDESSDYSGSGFFYPDRVRSGWENAAIQQAFRLHPQLFTQFQAGRVNYDFHGIENETTWQSARGQHKLSVKAGRFRNELSSRYRNQHLLTYRFYWSSREISAATTAGRFWHGDTGFRTDVAFRFGDQYFSVYYINTDAEFVGMAWTFPLSPRKDHNGDFFQIKGRELWAYGLQTRINEDVNYISFESGNRRSFFWGIDRSLMNNDRLNPSYIEYHLPRLIEAYQTYAD